MKRDRRKGRRAGRRAFTLIEVMLVVVIIGILAAIAAPMFSGRSQQARFAAARQDIVGGLGLALDLYEQDTGAYPSTEQGLAALLNPPAGMTSWNGPYLKKLEIPADPWGTAYRYQYPAAVSTRLYELTSAGPDKQFGTQDDISNLDGSAAAQ